MFIKVSTRVKLFRGSFSGSFQSCLCAIIFYPKLGIIQFLQRKGVLGKNYDMSVRCCYPRNVSSCSDGYAWQCPTCYTFKSIHHESFFSQPRLPLQKWLFMMQKWSRYLPVTEAAHDVEITEVSAVQLYQYFRDVCTWRLVNHDPQIVLGGAGKVIAIDESLFSHKLKLRLNKIITKTFPFTIYSIKEVDEQVKKCGYLEW